MSLMHKIIPNYIQVNLIEVEMDCFWDFNALKIFGVKITCYIIKTNECKIIFSAVHSKFNCFEWVSPTST